LDKSCAKDAENEQAVIDDDDDEIARLTGDEEKERTSAEAIQVKELMLQKQKRS
jgi:hypothetical protein